MENTVYAVAEEQVITQDDINDNYRNYAKKVTLNLQPEEKS